MHDEAMSAAALGDFIGKLAAELTVGTHRLIRAIGAFDASGGWFEEGALTCAKWLSWKIGMGAGEAREKVRVARRLGELPAIDGAFADGRLSYSKVRAMVRVANEDNEAALVDIALCCSGAQLERICRKFRTVDLGDTPTVEEAAEARYARHEWTEGGMMMLSIQLPADEGARVLSAIESAREASEGDRPSLADGVVTLAESFLAEGARPRRGGAPHEVVLHVSAESLATNDGGAFIDNHDGPCVSAETARRLACDASVATVVRDDAGAVLDVGRKSRTVPAAMRRALEVRDGSCCRFPGCDRTLYLDAHHVEHWADGGATKLSNLALLCSSHHRWVHEHGYRIEVSADGDHRFVAPSGEAVPRGPMVVNLPPDGATACVSDASCADGADVSAESLEPVGYMATFDHVEVIDVLCWAELQARQRRTAAAPVS